MPHSLCLWTLPFCFLFCFCNHIMSILFFVFIYLYIDFILFLVIFFFASISFVISIFFFFHFAENIYNHSISRNIANIITRYHLCMFCFLFCSLIILFYFLFLFLFFVCVWINGNNNKWDCKQVFNISSQHILLIILQFVHRKKYRSSLNTLCISF